MEQKIPKKFFVFQINAFELRLANSNNLEQDIFIRRQCVNKHL